MSHHDPVGSDGKENEHGDKSVGGKEGGIELAQVIGFHQGVLVEQGKAGEDDAGNGQTAQAEAEQHPGEEGEGDQVEEPGQAQCAGNSEETRDGMEIAGDVVTIVLAAIENVKPCAPEHDGGGDDQHARIQGSAHRNPGGGRGNAHGETEKQVRPAGETLGVGVGADDDTGRAAKGKR